MASWVNDACEGRDLWVLATEDCAMNKELVYTIYRRVTQEQAAQKAKQTEDETKEKAAREERKATWAGSVKR